MENHSDPFFLPYMVVDGPEQLDDCSCDLWYRSNEACEHAYAPYSRFMVGAAVLLDDDAIVTGGNQENASYPLCMCAERVALYAVAAVHPGKKILSLAVSARRHGSQECVPATPCGGCRQVIFEFEQRQRHPIRVILMGPDRKFFQFPSAAALLPLAFDRNSL